jgi:hypothetical protein
MAIWAAAIAAVVALTGFLVNGSLNRATEKRRACAEALSSIEAYLQLPFTFRRRPDNTPETLTRLGDLLSSVQVQVAFHKRYLQLEDKKVADAYTALYQKYDTTNPTYRQEALDTPPGRVEIPKGWPPSGDTKTEWDACIKLMREHVNRTRLAFWRA